MKDHKSLTRVFFTFCFTFIALSSFSQTSKVRLEIDSLNQALESSKHDSTTILTYIYLSNTYCKVDLDTAKVFAQIASKLALKKVEKSPNTERDTYVELLEAAYSNLATAEYRQHNFLSAESNYLKCVDLKIKYKRDGKPHMYNQLAACAMEMYDFARALDYAFKSLGWTEKIVNPTRPDKTVEVISYNMISTVYQKLGDWNKCHEYSLKCLELSKESGSPRITALIHNNMGTYFYEQEKNWEKSTEHYEIALELYRSAKDKRSEALVLYNLARLNEKNNPILSLEYLEKATKISRSIKDWKGLASSIWFSGHLEYKRGNLSKAEQLGIESLKICQSKKGTNLTLKKVADLLKEISIKRGDWKKALDYYELKIKAIDEIRNLDNQKEAMEVLMKHKVEKARSEEKLKTEIHQKESKLKSQKIELLNKDSQLQNTMLFGIVGVVIVLSALLFSVFKTYRKNEQLKELNAEKELRFLSQKVDLLETNLNAEMVERNTIVPERLNKNLSKLMKTSLTKRETEVLIELCKGKDNKSIAESLFISPNTVRTHLLKIYDKMDVSSRSQAIKKADNLNRLDT